MTVYTTVPLDDSNLDVTITESNDLVYIDINPAAFATIGVSKEYVDGRDTVTLSSANTYTDTSIAAIPPTDLTSYETIVNSEAGDATTLSSANTYTDNSIAAIPAVDLSSYETIVNSNAGDATTLSSANTYTDTSIAAIPATDLSAYETIVNSNAGDATTLSSANTYTDTSIAAIPATDLSAYSTTVQVEALPVSTFTNDAGYITSSTDSQTLSFANPNLTISNGNTVDLSSLTPTVPVTSVNTLTGNVVLGSDNIAEGVTNLYHTTPRVQAVIDTNSAGFATTTQVTTGDSTTLSSANLYTDNSIAAIPAVDLSSYETIVNSNSGDATTLSSANLYTDNSIAAIPAVDLTNLTDVVTIDPDINGMTIGATGITTGKWGSSAPLYFRSDNDGGALKNFVFDNVGQNIFTGMHWKTADSNKKLFRFDAVASGGVDPGDGSHSTNFVLSGTNNVFKSRFQNESATGLEFDADNINLITNNGVQINGSYTFPQNDGNTDQQLTTDGNGNVSWGETHVVYDTTTGTYAPPTMMNRSGDSAAFEFVTDDQTYGGAYSATLNMISWANLPSNNVAVVAFKTTNSNHLLNIKATGSADDGSHVADFAMRGDEGYFSTRDNSSAGGSLTNMTFEGTQLQFSSDTTTVFQSPVTNVKGLLKISDGVSDYTLPASDGSLDQVMTTNGDGHLSWVNAGGSIALANLTDVSTLNLQNNDLLMYNSVASEWQNTNLGISVTPTLTGNADCYVGIEYTVTVSNHATYDDPSYFCELYTDTGTLLETNSQFTDNNNGTLTVKIPLTGVYSGYEIRVKCQDFGDIQSEIETLSINTGAISGRYFRINNYAGPRLAPDGAGGFDEIGTLILTFNIFSGQQATGTLLTPFMSSGNTPTPYVATANYYSSTTGSAYLPWRAFDSSSTTGYWNIGTTALSADYLQIDIGSIQTVKSFKLLIGQSSNESVDIAMSDTGAFTGEEKIITKVAISDWATITIG
jgi:hypothetical protein